MSCSRSLLDLHAHALPMFRAWLHECDDVGISVLYYCVRRDPETQARLFRESRTKAEIDRAVRRLMDLGLEKYAVILRDSRVPAKSGADVTNAPPGLSFHDAHTVDGKTGSLALDCVGMVGGKPQWKDDTLYLKIGTIAERHCLTWSGRWTGRMKEKAHVQWDDGGRLTMPGLAQGKFA